MTICDLHQGQRGTILHVEGSGALSLRLMEMGFTPGTAVTLVSSGPSGDPLLLRLRSYTLTITRQEARKIIMTKEAVP